MRFKTLIYALTSCIFSRVCRSFFDRFIFIAQELCFIKNVQHTAYFHVFGHFSVRLPSIHKLFFNQWRTQIDAFAKILLAYSIEIDKWFGWECLCFDFNFNFNFITSDMFTGSQFSGYMNISCTLVCTTAIHIGFLHQLNKANQIWSLSKQLIHVHITLKCVNKIH